MKKIIAIAIAAASFVACNPPEADKVTEVTKDTTTIAAPPPVVPSVYTATDGDVTYTEKKVKVMKEGQWVDADDDIKLDNDVVVYRNGKVKKVDREVELQEGEVVTRSGDFFDRSGRAIENAWEATKEGAKDAGRAIKKAGEKVGEKVENAVDKDDNKDGN